LSVRQDSSGAAGGGADRAHAPAGESTTAIAEPIERLGIREPTFQRRKMRPAGPGIAALRTGQPSVERAVSSGIPARSDPARAARRGEINAV